MNNDNLEYNDSFLNDINITSNIRAPGEYKYFYCGENNTETDKSFLVFSTMWYTEKVTENMEIISSCYNSINTAQLFLNKKTNLYNLFIYKNIIDYKSENMSLKLLKIINLPSKNKSDNQNSKTINGSKNDKDYLNNMNSKIYFASNNYILLNETDCRILLIDIYTSSYLTIFSKTFEEKEILYNVFDTYDEVFLQNGQQKKRTYAFLSIKYQDRKTPTYKYSYFIIQKSIEKNIHLYPINLDLGNSEPLCLKIAKVNHKGYKDGEQKNFFLFCFLSTTTSLQLITDYDNLTLHQMFQKYCKFNFERGEEFIQNNKENKSNQLKKLKLWINKSTLKIEKIQLCQSMKIFLNINSKKICSLIYYFETKGIISYEFNYFDLPEEISKKIFIAQKELNINNGLDFMKRNDPKISAYNFLDCYQFKTKCFFGFSDKNLILAEKNVVHIYEENINFPVYTYEFFQENLSSLIILDGIGCTFILTSKKLFKIIYNQRYKIFSNEILFSKNKIHYYNYNYNMKKNIPINSDNEKPIFPLFEYKPEDIWNGYCNNLNIPTFLFTDNIYNDISEEKEDEEVEFPQKKENLNLDNKFLSKKCVLCNKESELICSHCGSRHYCCYEHLKYDYFSYHFFECQLIQFFKRKDIMKEKNLEKRYKILYNELIKLSGRILNFIFCRIYTKYDYIYFLNMILTLINIFMNFGFHVNLSDFCLMNFNLPNDKRRYKGERVIFYLEALFYYVQLHFLKCTFALRGGLYNLTDCYIKIIKNDIIPKLIPKSTKRLISLKFEKINKKIIYDNEYFLDFKSSLFFDVQKYIKYLGNNNYIDIIEEYIIKQLKSLSLLTKYKIKIHSNIEVQNTFVDINLMFDDHYSENTMYKYIVPYCYFSTSFYLVEIGKISQTIKLLRRMVGLNFDSSLNSKLCAFTYYNLGLLQYALGYFEIGIHNIETSYKLIVLNNFSENIKFYVIDSLGLAYLNQKNLFKAYILIQTSIKERKKLKKYQLKCNRLNIYLNYIVDLYEYNFISKTRFLIETKYKHYDSRKLIKFVLGEGDKELVISEQNLGQFIKVVEFIWKLSDNVLKQLNLDNPPKAPSTNREEIHHERNLSFNSDVSQISSTFIYKDNGNDKGELLEEYEEDIEVKTNLYDTLLTRQQQQEFKVLKTIYLKRDIILRDSLGYIEKFNINFDPIYADEFQKIIEKLKINFLLKEIFYCFQNEKWRDELYNYNQDNILFGLSKYLKLEKIQNMMAIERSKNIEIKKKEKLENKINNNIFDYSSIEEEENSENLQERNLDEWLNSKDENEENKYINDYNFNKKLKAISYNDYLKKKKNMNYKQFKRKFISSLKELEKENKNEDLFGFMNLDEDYLYTLYKNVYQNNPDQNFIFKNPFLILNYIYLEINKSDSTVSIIGNNNEIIHSVITKVKEEEYNFSFNSLDNSKKNEKNEILITKRNRNSSSSSSESYCGSDTTEKNLKSNKKLKKLSNSRLFQIEENENKKDKRNIKKNSTSDSNKKSLDKDKKKSKIQLDFDSNEKSLSDNNSDSFDLTEGNEGLFKKNIFKIINQEITFNFSPLKKIPTIVAKLFQNDNKINKKYRRKTQVIFSKNNEINILKTYKRKKSICLAQNKIKDKTFIEEIDMLNFSKINNIEEEEEKKKNFSIIQKKKRIYSFKNNSLESLSQKNNNTFNQRNNLKKNKGILKLTKRDIILGNYNSSKIFESEKLFSEKKYLKSKNNKKINLNLKKEFHQDKSNEYKFKTNIKKNNTNIQKNNEKSFNKKKSHDYIKYKNHSLIKHLIQYNKTQKRKNSINKSKNNISINYTKFLNFDVFPKKNNNNENRFKSQKERDKEIENEALEYLKLELNSKNKINKNRLINGSGVNNNLYKEFMKNNNYMKKREKGNEIIHSYMESIQKKRKEKKNNKNNKQQALYKKDIKKKMSFIKIEKKFQQYNFHFNDNLESYTSRANYKDIINKKNMIFENNNYINKINNNIKYISLINSNSYKYRTNKSKDLYNNKNINSDSKRLIQNYKLFPYPKKSNSMKVKENSGMNTLSNTNAYTQRSKRKIIERK